MARLSDAELFNAYGPRCSGKSAVVSLNGRGKVTVALVIVEAVKALNAVLVAYHYLTRAGDTGAYNCRQKVGGNGWSIHSLKIALDLNWLTNPYGAHLVTDFPPAMVAAILAIRTNSGAQVWSWGGSWSGNKDAMHWQIACSLRDLASGINWGTVAGYSPAPVVVTQKPADAPPVVTPPPYLGAKPTPTRRKPNMPVYVVNLVPGGQWAGERWLCWPDKTRELLRESHYSAADRGYGPPVAFADQTEWDRFLQIYPTRRP